MKKTMKITGLFLCTTLLLGLQSCKEDVIEENSITEISDPPIKSNSLKRVSEICLFDDLSFQSNSTNLVSCIWDLGGAVVILEPNINFVFNGGDIVNGTLVFDGGGLDGALLNSTLNIEGNVSLLSNEYNFEAARWNVTEGIVEDSIASKNTLHMNRAIATVKGLNGSSMYIDDLDAFFNVETAFANNVKMTENSILIPSNFHLRLGEMAYIKVQPTHMPAYALISMYDTENSSITGGHLVGDRAAHDYSPFTSVYGVSRDTHEFGYLLNIIGAHDAVVEGVKMSEAIGDGIMVSQSKLRNTDGSLTDGNRTTERLLITECEIFSVRRNGISITDAYETRIENCHIHHVGIGNQHYDSSGNLVYSSAGVAPKYGIDLEAYRERTADGTLLEYQKVEGVVIDNCDLYENEAGDIVSYSASYVVIENNRMDKRLGTGHSNNVVVKNNVFVNREAASVNGIFAINVKSKKILGEEIVQNIMVSGNQITGYYTGLTLGGNNINAENNTITDCRNGISLGILSNASVLNNDIISNLDIKCYGFIGYKSEIFNTVVDGGHVSVSHASMILQKINEFSTTTAYDLTFQNLTLDSNKSYKYTLMYDSKNILFKDIMSNTKLYKRNCTNIGRDNAQFQN